MFAEPEPNAPGRKPRRVDWRQAAELLARGSTIAAVAKRLGCSCRHLSRKRNHDPQFRRWLDELRQNPPEAPARGDADSKEVQIPAEAPTEGLAEDPGNAFEPAPRTPPASAGERMEALRQTVYDAIEAEVRGGNVRVILWLADRLKLVTPPNERTPGDELRAILGGMSSAELAEFNDLTDE